MGISLGGAVGDLLNNYVSGQQRQQAIQRQVQQQTLENAIQQQRQDAMNAQSAREAALFPGQQQGQQLDLAGKMQALLNSGAVPMGGTAAPTGAPVNASTGTPVLNAGQQSLAPPQVASLAPPQAPQGPDDPTSDLDTTATPPAASAPGTLGAAVTGLLPIGSVGGVAYGMTPGMSAPAKRQQRIQAIMDDFKSNYGRQITVGQAAMYADNPTEYDTAIRLAQQAGKPDAPPKSLSSEWVTKAGGPVFQSGGRLFDGSGNPLAASDVQRYVAPTKEPSDQTLYEIPDGKGGVIRVPRSQAVGQPAYVKPAPVSPAAQAAASGLSALEADHAALSAQPTPGVVARMAGMLPGAIGNYAEGAISPSTQVTASVGNDWALHYLQTLKSARMSVPTMRYVSDTYVPQAGDSPERITEKTNLREQKMQELRNLAQPVTANQYIHP